MSRLYVVLFLVFIVTLVNAYPVNPVNPASSESSTAAASEEVTVPWQYYARMAYHRISNWWQRVSDTTKTLMGGQTSNGESTSSVKMNQLKRLN
jgi:hypothetical protein